MARHEDPSGAVFNIGGQQGTITNVGRDMTVHGGQHQQVALQVGALSNSVAALRQGLETASLPATQKRDASEALQEAEHELDQARPDAGRFAGAMERFTEILKDGGALAAAGLGLVTPLHGIASLLGPLGASILRALSR